MGGCRFLSFFMGAEPPLGHTASRPSLAVAERAGLLSD